ncbi:cholesterol esterase [Streptomyces sp. SID2563]|nr:cholesterol esterase [Streptomyces sp. SID2563]
MVPSVIATAAIGVGLAQGALAASFSVSGQEFKVTAQELNGEGFVQYGSIATEDGADPTKPGKAHAVAVSGFRHATITNMCQSVVTPNLPFGLGSVTLKLKAADPKDTDKKVDATGLYLDVSELKGDAEFGNIDIGVRTGDLSDPGVQPKAGKYVNPNGFSQRADTAKLTGVQQKAWATTAGTFKLPGLHLSLSKGVDECY